MKQIQWFPGHMVKALKEMQKRVKLVDIVIELVDARAPLASRNPSIAELVQQKPTLVILTKKDLADDSKTRQWLHYFAKNNIPAYAMDVKKMDFKMIQKHTQKVLKEKFAKEAAKGMRPRPIRALICGIPNVGKSTFINQLAKRKATRVGNTPGLTRSQQWIKVEEDFELLDTPGVLWPNFEDKTVGIKLALIGTIKASVLPKEELVLHLMRFLTLHYPHQLKKRYEVDVLPVEDRASLQAALSLIAQKRGILMQQAQIDYTRTIEMLLKEFADGALGRFTLETQGENQWII